MSSRRRAVCLLVIAGALTVTFPIPAVAQRVQSSVVLVRADDVIAEDLYAAGNTIVVSGLIEGDLVAVAFDAIRIDGTVRGDVVAVANRVEITGTVEGSVRAAGREVIVDGEVGDDLFVGALTLRTGSTSAVSRDVLVWARTVELLGEVGRNVEGTQRRTSIGGRVERTVDVTTGVLTLLPGLRVGGDVRYTADRDATVAATATVEGTFVRAEALPPNLRVRGIALLARVMTVLGGLALGLGILWAVPARSLAASRALSRRPLLALSWGVGVASVPLALVIVTVGIVSLTSLSSSGPLVLVLVPLALGLAAMVGLALLTAPVPVALAVGGRLGAEWTSYARFVAGFAVLVLLWLVPWVGTIVIAVAALAGLGSWLVVEDEPSGPELRP
ncbi:MAG TPA: hypothetical protein VLB67_12215 [Acidimicrobiia bacterium]|nr:hypothetical protein [Acidimicrobiia bacterium]